MWKALSMELREHKSSFMVYFVLRLLVIIVMILQIFNQNYENVFLCILTLLLLVIPSLVQVTMKIELPTTLEIIILVFIFAAEILGRYGSSISYFRFGIPSCTRSTDSLRLQLDFRWWISSTAVKEWCSNCRRCSQPLWLFAFL